MKTIKPQKLGILTRVFENGREFYFVVTTMVFVPMSDPEHLLSEQSLWKTVMPELPPDSPLDAGMPKASGEVLVHGKAYVPGGAPKPVCAVRLKLGRVDKSLYAIGDRRWKMSGPTEPLPFLEMPLDWAHAFGGEGYALNPLGKGLKAIKGEDGREYQPLPNIEDPKNLIKSPNEKPQPAGFEAYDFAWPQRLSKVGTYDDEWLKTRFPGFAKDMKLSVFNTAPEDQWIEGLFEGGESFRLENMHPSIPVLEGRLPLLRARAFITQRVEGQEDIFKEIAQRIDTIHFFPRVERMLVLFRGMARIAEDDAADVLHVLIAAEGKNGEERSAEYYKQILDQRIDRKRGHLYALRDSDLLPANSVGTSGASAAPEPDGVTEHVMSEGLLRKNMSGRVEKQREKAKEVIKAAGANPDDYLKTQLPAAEEPPADLEKMPEYVMQQEELAEKAKAQYEVRKQEAEAATRKICADNGVNFDALMEEGKKRGGGPPKFFPSDEIQKFRQSLAESREAGVPMPDLEAMLDDPKFNERLAEARRNLTLAYQKFAHFFPAALSLPEERSEVMRTMLEEALSKGENLQGWDLTGANLKGLDFRGKDVRGVFMEAADLSGARFTGANLSDTVLARANLEGADFSGANLSGTNLGGAKLCGANFGKANLTRTVMYQADLSKAVFDEAILDQADLSEALFQDNSMKLVDASRLILLRTQWNKIVCAGAKFNECMFIETSMEESDFSGATVKKSVFVTVKANGARFCGANADNLRVVHHSEFAGADFRDAQLNTATLRGTNFEKGLFSRAFMNQTDMSECNLQGAKLDGISARESRFTRADLRGATLYGADLLSALFSNARVNGADFRRANLYRADFARVRGDKEVDFQGANVKWVRFVPRSEHG